MRSTILVMLPNWVGDAVMATPAIRAIREAHLDALLIGAGRAAICATLKGNPRLDRFVTLDRGTLSEARIAWQLRSERIGLAVLFPNSVRSALFARLAGAQRLIGFARYGRDILLTDRLFPRRGADGRPRPWPVMLDYNRLTKMAGASVRHNRQELFTTPVDEDLVDSVWSQCDFASSSRVVCLNPGAAFGSAKLWPAEYFAELARRIARDHDAGVLILCGPTERELARRIVKLASHPAVHSLADAPVSLGLTKACIRRCDLLVTTDSGPRHFAAAFDKPVVALFGPTHRQWTLTGHPLERQLQRTVSCGPCQRRTCPTDHRCMNELRPDDVLAAALPLLDREASHVA